MEISPQNENLEKE